MSTSARQILANQENAQHSTGPRTENGKRIVSLNALRHGLTGQVVVLPNEDRGRYERFSKALALELKPEGTVELMFAQTICDTQWRLERGRAMETNILAMGHIETLPNHVAELEIREVQTAMIEAIAYERHDRMLRNLHLQEARLTRILHKAMTELQGHQDRRKKEASDREAEAVAAYNYHKHNNLAFTPSEYGFAFTTSHLRQAALRRAWQKHVN